jgi:hypothetical protein
MGKKSTTKIQMILLTPENSFFTISIKAMMGSRSAMIPKIARTVMETPANVSSSIMSILKSNTPPGLLKNWCALLQDSYPPTIDHRLGTIDKA